MLKLLMSFLKVFAKTFVDVSLQVAADELSTYAYSEKPDRTRKAPRGNIPPKPAFVDEGLEPDYLTISVHPLNYELAVELLERRNLIN